MQPHTINFRTLDLNLLRVLDAVLSEGSLTKAARRLAMSQPAVSNAIGRLRDVLGDELVHRSGFGIVPTPRAQALWPSIRSALESLQHSLAPAEFVPSQAQATFVLAMADATAAELMPGLVHIIETQAPLVSMRVLPLTTRDPRGLLGEEKIDLAVGHFPAVLADLTAQTQGVQRLGVVFEHARLYDGDYVCVMRKNHPLARRKNISLDEFCAAHHLLVSFSGKPFGVC